MISSAKVRRPLRWQLAALSAGALLLALPTAVRSQAITPYNALNGATARSPVATLPLRGNVSMLTGAGGNIAVLSGPDGFFLADTGISVSKDKILAALKKLGPGPIRYAANTHWHWDHADGNGWVRAAGASVMAHPRTIAHLGDTIRVVEWGHTFTPIAPADRPNVPVAKSRTVQLNGETVEVKSIGDGHTDGDLSIQFKRANVLVLGDTFWNGFYPFIDYVGGGDIDRAIAQTNANLKVANDATLIVPGHGPVGRKKDLLTSRNMLVAVRDKVAAMKARGMTLKQVLAAKPTASFDATWGRGMVNTEMFVTLVYRGV